MQLKSLETQVNSFRSELNKIAALESKLEDHVSAPSAGGSDPRVSTIVDVLKRGSFLVTVRTSDILI